ncbi:hypothetical protein HYG86_12195 [Alkalicella caledoniensis]|uniref:Uncharacterized protein n=1 Tax=Alkalicella caledoniensis TaxID=2731377 RepID=A0A7G9W9W0_ALKCA|nr:hypothetical protein [Alkalicella caledoniensis]QNO15472.1 hypothetical protein HYG86_12195 [Alkalicella caledoniensis]
MDGYTKLPRKHLYFILVFCAVIIFAVSLETMFRVKDIGLYHNWVENMELMDNPQVLEAEIWNAYLTANLSHYFLTVIIPMIFSIHSYFAFVKVRISGLFVFLWIVLILGGLAYTAVELNFHSVFYYIRIVSYLGLTITTLSLSSVINESKLL